MPELVTVVVEGRSVAVPRGTLLADALRLAGAQHVPDMPCAGLGRCGKCRVTAHGELSAPSEAERRHLSETELAAGVRLACQCRALGSCTAAKAEPDKNVQTRIRLDGVMPEFAHDPLFARYGAAIDIGTTTLAAQLYGAQGLLAEAAAPNPQSSFGADVISRIGRSLAGDGAALAAAIRGALSSLLTAMAADAAIAPADIDAIVVTGNTAMLYLFTQRNPDCLAHAPFEADCLFGTALEAAALDLPCPRAQVYLPRCISAFVGADITCAILASGMCTRPATALLTDIGTNGEMALWHEGELLCCSTAAGPAFEGAGLSMGMGGRTGAVDRVWLDDAGALHAHVLGEGAPEGLCGSGVIDAVACLLRSGRMDETGVLEDAPAVIAAPAALSQADIRQVQLAKSAIAAGITAMLHSAQVAPAQVETLYIAGGFGSYLRIESAAAIGLIPPALAVRADVIGNAALSGAVMILLQKNHREVCVGLAGKAKTLELTTSADFIEAYTEGMLFELPEDAQ